MRWRQTEAIAGYLYVRLGHGGTLTDPLAAAERAAASASLTSLAHQDLMGMCIQVREDETVSAKTEKKGPGRA